MRRRGPGDGLNTPKPKSPANAGRLWSNGPMSSYRDERDALRARLAALEAEVADLREGPDREEAKRQLAELSAKVAEATAKLEGERAALSEVAEAIQKLRVSLEPDKNNNLEPDENKYKEPEPPKTPATSSGLPVGTGIFLGISLAILAVAFFLLKASSSPPDPHAAVMQVPGAPHAVDPIALLPTARAQSLVRESLVSIEARFVGSNGLVDLDAKGYMGSISYTFGETPPEPPPDPSIPVGAPQPSRPMPTQARVRLDRAGLQEEPVLIGFSSAAVPDPKCSLADVWKAAREAGAPEGAVAVVTYKRDPILPIRLLGRRDAASFAKDSGAAWLFVIEGTAISLRIEDPTCKVTRL